MSGCVSIDMIALDITDDPLGHADRVGPSDFVGEPRPADAPNAQTGVIGYEILVSLDEPFKPSNLENGRSHVEATS